MSPKPLPVPPTDPAELSGFPEVPKERLPEVLFRVHRMDREPEWFSAGLGEDGGRWDPPSDAAEAFGTCYTSTGPLGAYLEVFAELPLVTQAEIDRRALAILQLPPEPRWADMTNPIVVGRWHLDERISTGDDYRTCQLWAQQLFAAGFTGVYYNPRHDVGRTTSASVALFGDPGRQPGTIKVLARSAIPHEVVQEARQNYGLRVLPAVPPLPSFDPFDVEYGPESLT